MISEDVRKKLVKDRSRLDSRKFFFKEWSTDGIDSRQMLWTQNPSTASRTPTTAIVVKIWMIQADQLPVHHPTSTSTSKKTRQSWYFGKITAFDENHGFRDFRVSVIFYCPYRYYSDAENRLYCYVLLGCPSIHDLVSILQKSVVTNDMSIS